MNDGMLGREMADEDAPVEDVAGVVVNGHLARADEQRVLFVSNVNGVDRHSVEQTATYLPDVNLPAHFARDPGLNETADLALAVTRLRQRERDQEHDNEHSEERQCGERDYSLTR